MYEDDEIRRKARQVVAPLRRDGIDVLKLEDATRRQPKVVIEKGDLPAYELIAPEETLLDQETEMVLQIVRLLFAEGKWRFSDGTKTFSAPIEDQEFLDRIEAGEPFRKGDLFRCRVRLVQYQRDGKLQTEYHIVKVLEHIPRGVQMRLDEGDDAPT